MNSNPANVSIAFDHVDVELGGRTIIKNLTLDIAGGEFVCIVGPSGCGKTTVLRLIAGLLEPTRGTAFFRGRPLQEPRADIAVMFQDYGRALLPWRTVAGNVSLALEALDVRPPSERPRASPACWPRSGLSDKAGTIPERAVGRHAAAAADRALSRAAAAGAADGRAVRRARCDDAPNAAGRSALDRRGKRRDGVLRHARSRRGGVSRQSRDRPACRIRAASRATSTSVLPRPRNQLTTREDPEFARLRRHLFDFIKDADA